MKNLKLNIGRGLSVALSLAMLLGLSSIPNNNATVKANEYESPLDWIAEKTKNRISYNSDIISSNENDTFYTVITEQTNEEGTYEVYTPYDKPNLQEKSLKMARTSARASLPSTTLKVVSTVWSAPVGESLMTLDGGRWVTIIEKEFSGSAYYALVEFSDTAGKTYRGYINCDNINYDRNSIPTAVYSTSSSNKVRTNVNIDANQPIRMYTSTNTTSSHQLLSGEKLTVLKPEGRWLFVEHYNNGKNIRGYIDYLRCNYYSEGFAYKQMRTSSGIAYTGWRESLRGQLNYYIDNSVSYAQYTSFYEAIKSWNSLIDGGEGHLGGNEKPFTIGMTSASSGNTVSAVNTSSKAESYNTIYSNSNYDITKSNIYLNNYYSSINSSDSTNYLISVCAHEIGHTYGLDDFSSSSWPFPSLMNSQRNKNSIYQRQLADIVGAWNNTKGLYQ